MQWQAAFPTRIYLTGFMGCGKSTIGPLLARRLGYTFLDLDALIERQAGRSIPEIFAEGGEAAFRALEREALRRTVALDACVIATGGGALVSDDNLAWALRNGRVVYLQVSADELARRLAPEATHRPLLQDRHHRPLQGAALRRRIAAMLARREPWYRQAHHVVATDGLSIAETVEAVLHALCTYRESRNERR
ncbi:Shikimate kinase [Rhodothermus marinus SG0.5JP17-172]|jgi:shikimate kinase|uniref:shikimate kinase n=1 Tax=Rhodothermus marinus TaxID=29549 RepID=UPI000223DDF4|nr:shikimate kinase [Rhodothermus marinus]AEN74386.1 Shikimate kinase [Rhodothermus marinus SG0.5JP17-172]MBO2492660.1 shikimate kinase [Rhodothermus marinus]